MTDNNKTEVEVEENQLIAERYKKLALIRDTGQPTFPTDFRRTHLASVLMEA